MITQSPSIVNLSKALLAFQGAVDGVKRDSDNPFFKSKYADLEKVVDTARPHLQAVGIAFLQSPGAIKDNNLEMTTMLLHAESGEWLQGTGEIPLGKKDPQGAGSAQTYSQRYHLMAMLGLPPTDDDGEGAMDRSPAKAAAKPASASKPPSQYQAHLNAVTGAKDTPALKVAWDKIDADQTLGQVDYDNLKAAVNQKKAELVKPAVPPSFENLQP